jgi:hypothetical protein
LVDLGELPVPVLARVLQAGLQLVGVFGPIPELVPLLRSTDPALCVGERGVSALLKISLEERNRSVITAAGAIKPFVYAASSISMCYSGSRMKQEYYSVELHTQREKRDPSRCLLDG